MRGRMMVLPPLRANAHLPQLPIPSHLSLTAQQRLAPGTRLHKTVENLGLRLGVDKIPLILRRAGVRPPIVQPKGTLEPYWRASTLVRPPVKAVPIPHNKTLLGRFMIKEWKRMQKAQEAGSHNWTGVPEGHVRNPFLPWFNPISRRWNPPLYSRRRQADMSKEARRLNLFNVLPSGPKTRPEYSNKEMLAWQVEETAEGDPVAVDLGQVKWFGVYMKKLNPFGKGKFGAEMSLEELKAGLGVGGLPPKGKLEYVENKALSEERKLGDGYDRWGPYAGKMELFKETKRHLRKEKKVAEVKSRMILMPQRVAEWRKEKKEARIKAAPALPY